VYLELSSTGRKLSYFLDWSRSSAYTVCDLTFLVYCTMSVISQKSRIELRNNLSKPDSQDTAPGILKFSDLLNLKCFWLILHKKGRSYMTLAMRDWFKVLSTKKIPHAGILLSAFNQEHGSRSTFWFLPGRGSPKNKCRSAEGWDTAKKGWEAGR
jgi:hypothetical protein